MPNCGGHCTDAEPAVPAWAHCTVGVGPALLSPGSAPVRWQAARRRLTDPARRSRGVKPSLQQAGADRPEA